PRTGDRYPAPRLSSHVRFIIARASFDNIVASVPLNEVRPTLADHVIVSATRLFACIVAEDLVNAMLDRCSHKGCSLHEGKFERNTITCPCHGSSFRLDGTIVKGPATSPQPSLDVRITSGRVEIRGPVTQ
ncbi:MAG: Rieske (2Fe-2S) protein, partial [Actinomycetota bacterium]|nr:Rieske (2Fe-2S) protein [Actinomycetota bacterium]